MELFIPSSEMNCLKMLNPRFLLQCNYWVGLLVGMGQSGFK